MSAYIKRPWLEQYSAGQSADIVIENKTMLGMFQASLKRTPNAIAIRYFDRAITMDELDLASDALAICLIKHGFMPKDRFGVCTQNNPAFVIGLLAAWKAGGVAVAINPMNKEREFLYLLKDSGASALLCLDEIYKSVARSVITGGDTKVDTVITVSSLDWQTRSDLRLFKGVERIKFSEALDLMDIVTQHIPSKPDIFACGPDDLAMITYTSGTTGEPKGAMNTHGNMTFNSQVYRDWMCLKSDDSVLGVAPLFHVTGLIGHVGLSMLLGCPLILMHRYHPQVMLDTICEHKPSFTIAAITIFLSLLDLPNVTAEDFKSLRVLYSGGAPIAPAIVERFQNKTGLYIHNIYGLTETNSPSHAVPLGANAPVDPNSGALSVGVPIFNTITRVIDEEGEEVAIGEIGEFATSGPQVVPGYWNKPEATATSLPGGELRTGDVGFMDEQGWFYLVDRKKDMINVGGYKVWPREVEDVLYSHPDVREVAVVGIPDDYRGESVKAYVVLKLDAQTTTAQLISYCKANMANYKYPRFIELIDELPKTLTGKILRRSLRNLS